MTPDLFGQMMLQSVRYALGRMTTAPADTTGALVCAWSAIPANWQALIERDIRSEVERAERVGETVGHQCDHETWTDCLAWITEMHEISERIDDE